MTPDTDNLIDRIRRGRTDSVVELLQCADWTVALEKGAVNALQWFVYYGDVTALKMALRAGSTLDSLDLGAELGNAAFFGHWKMCDFLLGQGADVNYQQADTGETALHSALAKAGRPYYAYVVRRLLEAGARVNAATIPGVETGAFMRDVRTTGETPLHRAAAFADETTIDLLLDHGADKHARDSRGDSPLTWASVHLRTGAILEKLAFGEHTIGPNAKARITSDHGAGWGNGMERNLLGDYLPESSD